MTAWALTWVCQGALVASMTSAANRLLPRLNGATRYGIWWSALLFTAAAGAATFPLAPSADEIVGGSSSGNLGPSHMLIVPSAPRGLVAVLVGVWAAILLVKLVRLIAAIHAVHLLRDSCAPIPATIESELPLWLEFRERGRRASLMICDRVAGPTVLGFVDPYIAIPSFLIQELTRHELDLVILHERAHVLRRDDWMKLAQEMMLAPLWMHPVAVFVSRQLGREREIACDEWVIARTEQPRTYARCLTRAAEAQRRGCTARVTPQPLLGPSLIVKRIELSQRVDRLLAHGVPVPLGLSAWRLSSIAALMTALACTVGTLPLVTELGEIVVPDVSSPAQGVGTLVTAHVLPRVMPSRATPRLPRAAAGRRAAALPAPPMAPVAPGDHEAPVASAAEADSGDGEPAVLPSKTFGGVHSIVPAAAARAVVTETATPWQKASNASVRFAEGLTRAGTSLARRF
jgi:beta-lactamase regulating signal transducer with metallopeptidase domain